MAAPLTVTVDGEPVPGFAGQTIAGLLLARGRPAWRVTARRGTPRGLFCGIGVCFDCVLTVNGLRDVRACQRRAADGDVIETDTAQPETAPRDAAPPATAPPATAPPATAPPATAPPATAPPATAPSDAAPPATAPSDAAHGEAHGD